MLHQTPFSLAATAIPLDCGFRKQWTWHHHSHVHHFLCRASRAHRCQTETRERRTLTHWMTAAGSGGCSAGCRRRHGWRWHWPDPWPACRWRWSGRSSSTDAHLWPTWLVWEGKWLSGRYHLLFPLKIYIYVFIVIFLLKENAGLALGNAKGNYMNGSQPPLISVNCSHVVLWYPGQEFLLQETAIQNCSF